MEHKKTFEMDQKKQIVTNAIGGADISLKLMQIEKKTFQTQSQLDSANNELKSKMSIISRLEDRLKQAREDRHKLELSHDRTLAELTQKVG